MRHKCKHKFHENQCVLCGIEMKEIESKYYDGSYCPKCKSVAISSSISIHECVNVFLTSATLSCNECGCKFYTHLVPGSGPVESNVYHFETEIEEEESK